MVRMLSTYVCQVLLYVLAADLAHHVRRQCWGPHDLFELGDLIVQTDELSIRPSLDAILATAFLKHRGAHLQVVVHNALVLEH